MRFIIILSLMFGFFSCKTIKNENSKIRGHFEDSTSEDLLKFDGQQTVVPEYAPNQDIVVSLDIANLVVSDIEKNILREFNIEGATLIKQILTKLDRIYLVVRKNIDENSPDLGILREVLGEDFKKIQFIKHSKEGNTTMWARDWSPISARSSDGTIRFLDFNYSPSRKVDDSTVSVLAKEMNRERISMPIYNEGGNFMISGNGDCFMSEIVIEKNARKEASKDLILNKEQIVSYYQKFAGCKRVNIFPALPFEETGHIDMWAKLLNDETVLINELRDEAIAKEPFATLTNDLREIKNFLEERAKEFSDLGYNVIRIPMPLPDLYGSFVRSYTNSLIVGDTIFTPRYQINHHAVVSPAKASEYFDKALLPLYENEVSSVHEKFGLKTVFVNSDLLISIQGAVHCATMQIPR